ncbi:MAG: hypothetical protein HG467_004085 [Clostridiales bacterium]|nr:hypothetical protein [Clostridiales bacterium]
MEDFLQGKIENMDSVTLAKILLIVGILGILAIGTLITVVVIDSNKKMEELKNKPVETNVQSQKDLEELKSQIPGIPLY